MSDAMVGSYPRMLLLEITKILYLQHYYDTGCLDREIFVLERVSQHGS